MLEPVSIEPMCYKIFCNHINMLINNHLQITFTSYFSKLFKAAAATLTGQQ